MGSRALRLGAAVVFATMAVGVILLGLAMIRYPGGTEIDPRTGGHSFWLNLLCDLTGERALNGASNLAGRGFARAGMAAFSVGMGAFWLILPAEFPEHRATAATVRVAGAVSALGFLAVPIAPGAWHPVAVFSAAVPGVLAAGLGVVATIRYVRDKLLVVTASGAIITATIDSVLYARRVMDHFRSCPPALPIFQRLITLFVLAWSAATALRVLRPRARDRGPGRPPPSSVHQG